MLIVLDLVLGIIKKWYYGTYDNSTEYFNYSERPDLNLSTTHQYTMIKRGRMVEWFVDGNLLFTTTIDLSTDMKLMGFLVSDKHTIEIDYLTIKLI